MVQAVKNFLLPTAHFCALLVASDGQFQLLAVSETLCQVEGVARAQERVLLGLQGARQNLCILDVGAAIATPCAIVVSPHGPGQVAHTVRLVAIDEFVQHTAVTPSQPVVDQLFSLVAQWGINNVQGVAILCQFGFG